MAERRSPVIGVLALQGCVDRHRPHVEGAGARFMAVKTPEQFAQADGFILPGGESTTMLKLIDAFGLEESLKREFAQKPVWGICAGSIIMADKVENPQQKSFGLLPLTVRRNAYGRQLESHKMDIGGYEVSFIRAPVFTEIGAGVETLASEDGKPVWVKAGNKMATSFHPELTLEYPSPMHAMFVGMVRNSETNTGTVTFP